MSFRIELLPEQVLDHNARVDARLGLITIGSFHEHFIAPLQFWGVTDYEQHWRQSVLRLIEGSDSSCLVTSMYDPQTAEFIYWWPLYRLGNTVFIQNHILFLGSLKTPFDSSNPFSHVPPRKTINEEGELISEWQLAIDDFVAFLKK